MNVKTAKTLVGQNIQWTDKLDKRLVSPVKFGFLIGLRGKSALIDFGGTTDWRECADMADVKAHEPIRRTLL